MFSKSLDCCAKSRFQRGERRRTREGDTSAAEAAEDSGSVWVVQGKIATSFRICWRILLGKGEG